MNDYNGVQLIGLIIVVASAIILYFGWCRK